MEVHVEKLSADQALSEKTVEDLAKQGWKLTCVDRGGIVFGANENKPFVRYYFYKE